MSKEFIEQLKTIKKAKSKELSVWEKDFLKSANEKVEKFGVNTAFSDKQILVIQKIHDKISGVKTEFKPVQKSEPAENPFPTASENPFPTASA
jgi:hypothetical protein